MGVTIAVSDPRAIMIVFSLCIGAFENSYFMRQASLFAEKRNEFGNNRTQLPTVHDHVDGAFFEKHLRPLKALRQFFPHRLLDDAGPGKAD